MSSRPLIIGHRGASAHLPENTLESFGMAFEQMHADMIEFDVQITKDGIPVVIHDETLERTTNGRGGVSHFTLDELKKLDAGFGFDPKKDRSFPHRGKGILIPSLEDVLSRFRGRKLAIEIKGREPELIKRILELASRYGEKEQIVVGSLHDDVYKKLVRIAPPFKLFTSKRKVMRLLAEYYIKRKNPKREPALVASMPVKNRYFDLKEKNWIDWLKSKGVTVYYWTVNDPEMMALLCKRQADGIMSDDPGLLSETISLSPGTAPKVF